MMQRIARAELVVLASASLRRRRLLGEWASAAGLPVVVREPPVDDASVHLPLTGASLVMALACIKALQVPCADRELVVAADTLAFVDGTVLGKPEGDADARAMIDRCAGHAHDVLTGVALRTQAGVEVFVDRAEVVLGALSPTSIDEYIRSGLWRGKAAAYDYPERLQAGWPLECRGDMTTVSGLPMDLLRPRLDSLCGVSAAKA